MDWIVFFAGILIGASIYEEHDKYHNTSYKYNFDNDDYEQYLFERKLLRNSQNKRPFLT